MKDRTSQTNGQSQGTGEQSEYWTKPKLTDEQVDEWHKLATFAKTVEDALGDLLVAIAEAKIADEHKPRILDWLERADSFKGLSYFLAPQSEWTGGDSSDPANFCYRLPHICKP